ncbi:MAG: hypothetical protein P8X57_05180 [Cyclobacteriaceae bacterium]
MKANMNLIIPGALTLALVMTACSSDDDTGVTPPPPPPPPPTDKIETFSFSSNGTSREVEIYIPAEYDSTSDLPTIYLIDHCEQTDCVDDFDEVIAGVQSVTGFYALVITFKDLIDDEEINPQEYPKVRDLFNDLVTYVDANYPNNFSRTLIGRGKSGSVVLRNLFEDETPVFQNFIASDASAIVYLTDIIEDKEFTQELDNKKLHYSFTSSTDNDLNVNFINTIIDKDLTWLEFESVDYPNLTYPDAQSTVFPEGLKFLFEN